MFIQAVFFLGLGFALTTVVDARLSLLRISHWQNHKLHSEYKREELQASSSRLATIATRGTTELGNGHFLGEDENDDDDVAPFPRLQMEYDRHTHDNRRRLEQEQDSHRAIRELVDFSGSSSHSFSFSFSLPTNIASAHPSSAPQLIDGFPDFTDDLSFSLSSEGTIDDSSVGSGFPSPSPSNMVPTIQPTTPLPTPILSVQQSQPTVPTINGDSNSAVQTPSVAPSDSPTVSDIDPQSLADAIEEEEEEANPNTVADSDASRVAIIAVLVGVAVAVGTALALRKLRRSRQGGLSTASDPASSSEMWSEEGQHLNHRSPTHSELP